MNTSRQSLLVSVLLALLVAALVALGAVALFRHGSNGYGMMRGSGYRGEGFGYDGMMRGSYAGMMGRAGYAGMMGGVQPFARGMGNFGAGAVQEKATPADLAAVRDRVEQQLAQDGYAGFKVAEVMAFSNNDYVVVENTSGKPAFELLADPRGRWLMPEPGPDMMWNSGYGMMRGLHGSAPSRLSEKQARARATRWLHRNGSRDAVLSATAFPGYYTLDLGRAGKPTAMLSVNGRTGSVWFHSWHGRFLAERDF